MGMIGCLARIEQNDLEQMLKDSSLLETKLDELMENESPEQIDLDKSWEAIFYLLTGYGIADIDKAQAPLSWAIFSGQVVDEEQDLGYGPGNYVTAEQVKQVDAALQSISEEEMRRRFDGKKMNSEGIYPEVWDDPAALDYLIDNFLSLKKFYKEAANQSQAVITYVS